MQEVEGITARLASGLPEARANLEAGGDPGADFHPRVETALQLQPVAMVDAIMAKRNTGTRIIDAPLVIGLGPGFDRWCRRARGGGDQPGHDSWTVILQGGAEPDTGIPGPIAGYGRERLIRAPVDESSRPGRASAAWWRAGKPLAQWAAVW